MSCFLIIISRIIINIYDAITFDVMLRISGIGRDQMDNDTLYLYGLGKNGIFW